MRPTVYTILPQEHLGLKLALNIFSAPVPPPDETSALIQLTKTITELEITSASAG